MSNNRLNKERERMRFAFEKATEEAAVKSAKYKSRVEKAPMLIYNNGLGNTLAFIHANRTKEGWEDLYRHIHEWLNKKYLLTRGQLSDEAKMAGQLLDAQLFDEAAYRAITREVLKLLEGLKRFATSPEPQKAPTDKTEEE